MASQSLPGKTLTFHAESYYQRVPNICTFMHAFSSMLTLTQSHLTSSFIFHPFIPFYPIIHPGLSDILSITNTGWGPHYSVFP